MRSLKDLIRHHKDFIQTNSIPIDGKFHNLDIVMKFFARLISEPFDFGLGDKYSFNTVMYYFNIWLEEQIKSLGALKQWKHIVNQKLYLDIIDLLCLDTTSVGGTKFSDEVREIVEKKQNEWSFRSEVGQKQEKAFHRLLAEIIEDKNPQMENKIRATFGEIYNKYSYILFQIYSSRYGFNICSCGGKCFLNNPEFENDYQSTRSYHLTPNNKICPESNKPVNIGFAKRK